VPLTPPVGPASLAVGPYPPSSRGGGWSTIRLLLQDGGREGSSLAQAASPPWTKKAPWSPYGGIGVRGGVLEKRTHVSALFFPSRTTRPTCSYLTCFALYKILFRHRPSTESIRVSRWARYIFGILFLKKLSFKINLPPIRKTHNPDSDIAMLILQN